MILNFLCCPRVSINKFFHFKIIQSESLIDKQKLAEIVRADKGFRQKQLKHKSRLVKLQTSEVNQNTKSN